MESLYVLIVLAVLSGFSHGFMVIEDRIDEGHVLHTIVKIIRKILDVVMGNVEHKKK